MIPSAFSSSAVLSEARAIAPEGFRFILVDEPLLATPHWRAQTKNLIYRPTDIYEHGLRHRRQAHFLPFVDAIVCTSPFVQRSLPRHSKPELVLGNGVDWTRFANSESAPNRDGVVYVGALDSRFDWQFLSALAHALPAERLHIFGAGSSKPNTNLPANVSLMGPVEYSELPRVLSSYRYGLLPFKDIPLNRGRSPMKLFEYLAAGLFVIAPRFASPSEVPGLIAFGSHVSSAIASTIKALPASNEAGRDAAKDQDWASRAEVLMSFLLEIERR